MATVIVFGPTGNVASVAAQTAAKNGAQKVWLAMRDPSKPIAGLPPATEQAGPFTRIHADLTKPATITAALAVSKATHAFIYLAFGTDMRETAEALKAGGVTFVVFLSSFTIGRTQGGLKDIAPSDMVPYAHAAVEIVLEEVFGAEGVVAVRPGGFATNLLRYKEGVLKGEVSMFGAGFRMDMITPGDMGRVSGTLLARGAPLDGEPRKVFLYGPKLLSQRDGLQIVADVLGKGEIKFTALSVDEALEEWTGQGVPLPLAEYMAKNMADDTVPEGEEAAWYPNFEEGVVNVMKYTGKPATGLREWVEANKELWE